MKRKNMYGKSLPVLRSIGAELESGKTVVFKGAEADELDTLARQIGVKFGLTGAEVLDRLKK